MFFPELVRLDRPRGGFRNLRQRISEADDTALKIVGVSNNQVHEPGKLLSKMNQGVLGVICSAPASKIVEAIGKLFVVHIISF